MNINFVNTCILGAFIFISLYFLTLYAFRKEERYFLFFALGSLSSIIRILSYAFVAMGSDYPVLYFLGQVGSCLSFIWGPLLFVILADLMFNQMINKKIVYALTVYCIVLSILIIFVFVPYYPNQPIYDVSVVGMMGLASYIFIKAFIKHLQYSAVMFAINIIILLSVLHDVLLGLNIFTSEVGELHQFAFLVYMFVLSIILTKKHNMQEQAHLKAQINFLNAQIQPHFLYNTIGTIRACSRTDTERARDLLDNFSVYLRGKLKNSEELYTSLKDEIELVKAYLSIEKARFKHRLVVEYDIEDDIDILVPCLVIQPIIENAVKHGLNAKIAGGKISISVKRKDGNVLVTVEDNGAGMTPKHVKQIYESKNEGIGIRNTIERIRLYFGTEVQIESEPDVGTKVVMVIPESHDKPKKRGRR